MPEVVRLENITELAVRIFLEAHQLPDALSTIMMAAQGGVHRFRVKRLVLPDWTPKDELLIIVDQCFLDDFDGQRRQRHHDRLAVFDAVCRNDHVRVYTVEID